MTHKYWFNKPGLRILQHLLFIAFSFFILLNFFKVGRQAVLVDYIYAGLFLATLLPVIYFNLYWVLPVIRKNKKWWFRISLLVALIIFFAWVNQKLFQDWSTKLFPDFFFISYYNFWEITLFFLGFLSITTLLKLSKSWFVVNELQRAVLDIEKQKVQAELKALKSQVNPHFFFNTLNNIYSMSLDKDSRLPATVLQLSDLMRYFLYDANEEFVPLQKEIDLLKHYIDLQKIRSGKELYIETEFEEITNGKKIAPLLLISFLENAFKHGAKGNINATYVKVRLNADKNKINFQVENNVGETDEVNNKEYSGLGLENVRRRLELIYPGKHQLEITKDSKRFNVQLQLEL